MTLDLRITPFRAGIAAEHLRDQVDAERFVKGVEATIAVPVADVRREPLDTAPLETQALMGESLVRYAEQDDFALIQLKNDSYVGWVRTSALRDGTISPTHRIRAPRTFVYPEASIKAPPLCALSMATAVVVAEQHERFARLSDGSYVMAEHLRRLDEHEPDFIKTALQFLHTPYLWGGRSGFGIDCSALVQISLVMAGIPAPRDSDMQENEHISQKWEPVLGQKYAQQNPLSSSEAGEQQKTLSSSEAGEQNKITRGDLLFWKGHVAFALSNKEILHANAHHMMVAIEPLEPALARIAASGTPLRAVRRINRENKR